MMRIVYLHGFASSPQSSKARFFREEFTSRGIPFEAPELEEGHFERLTITSQLGVVERAVAGRPAVLMGSSLGGYVAALCAVRHPELVDRLVLLAPAFRFLERFRSRYRAEELDRWKQQGTVPVFHYGTQTEQRLSYSLLEDAEGYELEPAFKQPALILHGSQDPVVPASVSRAYSAAHPNVRLEILRSGHELTDVLPELWRHVKTFLEVV